MFEDDLWAAAVGQLNFVEKEKAHSVKHLKESPHDKQAETLIPQPSFASCNKVTQSWESASQETWRKCLREP